MDSTIQQVKWMIWNLSFFRFKAPRFKASSLKVQVSRFKLQASSFKVSRFKVQASRRKVQGSRFKVQASSFKLQASRFTVQGSRFKVQGSRFQLPCVVCVCVCLFFAALPSKPHVFMWLRSFRQKLRRRGRRTQALEERGCFAPLKRGRRSRSRRRCGFGGSAAL